VSERVRRLASPLVIGALAAAGTLALRLRDPHVAGAWGGCPTKLLTDLDCPFCGSLRAVNDLTHLDLGAALSSNLVFVLAVPLILLLWGRRLVACWRGGDAMRPLTVPTWVWVVGLVALGAFTVARNLPGSWLAA
jgi:Protein of unknown function (DUF2752)